MRVTPRRRFAAGAWFGLAILLITGCADAEPPTSSLSPQMTDDPTSAEEEILGNLYVDGRPLTSADGDYYVTLQRVGSGPLGVTQMWVNPAGYDNWMYGWYFSLADDGPCPIGGPEKHQVVRGRQGGEEVHCVDLDAEYVFTLYRGLPSNNQVIKRFTIDYPMWSKAPDVRHTLSSAENRATIENHSGTLNINTLFIDLYASVDIGTNSRGWDTPVLWIDNAGQNNSTTAFSNENGTGIVEGTTQDWFRFSGGASTFSLLIPRNDCESGLPFWVCNRHRQPLAKLWIYRAGVLVDSTNWFAYQTAEYLGLRTRRFSEAGTYQVALQIMRPDEAVPPAPTDPSADAAWRTINVTNPVTPPNPAVLTSLSLTPSSMQLATDGQAPSQGTFTATPYDQYGNVMTGMTFTWTIDNTSVVSFSGKFGPPTGSTATVVARATGNTWVRVSANGANGTLTRGALTQVNCHQTGGCM